MVVWCLAVHVSLNNIFLLYIVSCRIVEVSATLWWLFRYLLSTVCGKKVSPKVSCHFLSNHLEFLREILHVYYLFMYTEKKPSGIWLPSITAKL